MDPALSHSYMLIIIPPSDPSPLILRPAGASTYQPVANVRKKTQMRPLLPSITTTIELLSLCCDPFAYANKAMCPSYIAARSRPTRAPRPDTTRTSWQTFPLNGYPKVFIPRTTKRMKLRVPLFQIDLNPGLIQALKCFQTPRRTVILRPRRTVSYCDLSLFSWYMYLSMYGPALSWE